MPDSIRNWLIAFMELAGALLAGGVVDWLVVAALRHDAGPAQRVRGALARALRGQPEIWSVLAALALFRPFDFVHGRSLVWLDRLTLALAVLSVTLFAARLVGWLIRAFLAKDTVTAPSGSIFVNLTRLVVWAIGITVMLGALGVSIGPLVASLGVMGIAVSLGLQDTLANFFSGLQITMSRQIQPGEYIRLSTGEEGTVVDVTWRNTTMHAPSNDLVIIPNSVIARSQITNFTAEDEEHTAAIAFSVRYGSDLEHVTRVARDVAREVRDELPGAVKSFEPACRFRAFGPEGISAAVTIRVVRYQASAEVTSALIERLHARLAEEGIAFGTGAVVSATARPV